MSTYPFIPIAKRYEKEDEHGRPIGDFCFDYELGLIMTSKATPHNLHLQTKPPSKMLSG